MIQVTKDCLDLFRRAKVGMLFISPSALAPVV